ncbi:MAG: DUF4124 domain-containing protein [Burkholderiales bacterium]
MFSILLVYGIPAHAQIYKWVDDAGNKHYSYSPPASSTKTIQLEPARPAIYVPATAPTIPLPREDEYDWQYARQLQANRFAEEARQSQARQNATRQAAHAECLTQRRVDCDGANNYSNPPRVVVGARQTIVPTLPVRPATSAVASSPLSRPVR